MGRVELTNLAVGYGEDPLLEKINASLSKGDFCVLFGANGMGKSTLIKSIRGTLPIINGSISILGKDVSKFSQLDLSKVISVVTTQKNIAPGLSVKDVVSFGRTPYLKSFSNYSKEDIEIIDRYVTKLDLNVLLDRGFDELSDGQKQRVMLCRALVQSTDIILLDEPTAHLDVKNKINTFRLLQGIAKDEGKIVLCSTHEIETGLSYSNMTWLIDKNAQFFTAGTTSLTKEKVYDMLFEAVG